MISRRGFLRFIGVTPAIPVTRLLPAIAPAATAVVPLGVPLLFNYYPLPSYSVDDIIKRELAEAWAERIDLEMLA